MASVRAVAGAPHSACFVLCPLDAPHGPADLERVLQLSDKEGGHGKVHVAFLPRDAKGVAEIAGEVSQELRLRRQLGASLLDARNVAHPMLALSHVIWAVLEAQGDSDQEVPPPPLSPLALSPSFSRSRSLFRSLSLSVVVRLTRTRCL